MHRLAVIGLRNIGKGHIRRSQNSDDVNVVAAVDLDPALCAEAEQEFGLEFTCNDAAELFASPNIDGVVVALPNHLHVPVSIQALEAGKHVLVEKPIANRSADVQALIDARDAAGKVVMVGMNQRFSPQVYGIRRQIQSGVIGDIYLAKTGWCMRYLPEGLMYRGAWGFKKDVAGGGPMIDLGIHMLDKLLFMMDFPEVKAVTGIASTGIGSVDGPTRGIEYDIEDHALGLIHLKGGGCIHVEAAYYHNAPEGEGSVNFMFSGSKGYIHDGKVVVMNRDEEVEQSWEPDESAPRTCIEHFGRVLAGKEELVSTCEQGLIGLRIMEAVYRSAETGETVSLE